MSWGHLYYIRLEQHAGVRNSQIQTHNKTSTIGVLCLDGVGAHLETLELVEKRIPAEGERSISRSIAVDKT